MKVKNYQHGNYFYAFDCVIYGHIEMSWKEWIEASKYLLRSRCLQDKNDLIKKEFETKRYTWRNVRVTATQKLFKHFNLPRYKKQNYAIKIAKSI